MTELYRQVYELSLLSSSDKEINAMTDIFALYEEQIRCLRDELAKASFLSEIRATNEDRLKTTVEEQAFTISVLQAAVNGAINAEPVAVAPPAPVVQEAPALTSFERCQLMTQIERSEVALSELQAKSAAELQAANEHASAIEEKYFAAAKLVDSLQAQISAISVDCEAVEGERHQLGLLLQDQIEHVLNLKTELSLSHDQISALQKDSSALALAKEERKQALAAKTAAEKKLAQVERKNDVLEREASKFKSFRHQSREALDLAKRTFDDTTKRVDELSNELVRERMERRYLTMMIDSLNHSDVLELKGGYLSLYSFSPERVLAINGEQNDSIDTSYPLGLWTNRLGMCCIVAVGNQANENGERDLIMPKADGLSQRGHAIICPSKTDIPHIVTELMKYNAIACNEAIARCRAITSEIARCTNYDENRILSNKRLIALSKEKTSTGLSVLTNRATVSRKRKGK